MATTSNPNLNLSSSWDTVKKHSRQISGGFRLSPTKDIKFSKFQETEAPITMNLDGTELVFKNHIWHMASQNGEVVHQQMLQLREQNKQLQEENQLLKFKMSVLMDMLAAAKLDHLNSELELQKLKPN